MAEVFNRANLGPKDYDLDTWETIHEVQSSIVGSLMFYFCATNVTSDDTDDMPRTAIKVNARIIDSEGNIVHWIVPNRTIESGNLSFDGDQKIVMKPGDKLQVRASDNGIVFYASILTGLRMTV